MSRAKKLKSVVRNKIFREVGDSAFCDICEYDFDREIINEALHSSQIIKEMIDSYLDIRMFRYGQYYSDIVIKNKGKCGLRQQSNKLVLFQGL